jgi:hypothetical protein
LGLRRAIQADKDGGEHVLTVGSGERGVKGARTQVHKGHVVR